MICVSQKRCIFHGQIQNYLLYKVKPQRVHLLRDTLYVILDTMLLFDCYNIRRHFLFFFFFITFRLLSILLTTPFEILYDGPFYYVTGRTATAPDAVTKKILTTSGRSRGTDVVVLFYVYHVKSPVQKRFVNTYLFSNLFFLSRVSHKKLNIGFFFPCRFSFAANSHTLSQSIRQIHILCGTKQKNNNK